MFFIRNQIKYKEPLFRPPSEADSLIFQIAHGCPHNACLFCPMYKGVRYKVRDLSELILEIKNAAREYPNTSRIFLADGDVLYLDFETLKTIFLTINSEFPKLARVSMYANGSSILAKEKNELALLKKLKLYTLYMGLETGDEEILLKVKKGETAKDMIDAVKFAQSLDIRMCVFSLLGLGGKKYSKKNAKNTAIAINKMNPKFYAILRFIKAPHIPMFDDYEPISDYYSIQELYETLNFLDVKNCLIRANHNSIPFPISARFPKDKQSVLASIKYLLDSPDIDKNLTSGNIFSL